MKTVPDHGQRPLLLSRDLRLAGRDLRLDGPDLADGQAVEQLSLPGIDMPPSRTSRRAPRADSRPAKVPSTDDPLLAAFQRRLTAQGRAAKGRAAYHYQMRSMLMLAARQAGRTISCADLFQDEALLGHVLVDEEAPTFGTRVSKWTLAQRRSAARDFVKLMRPELLPLLGEEPHNRLDRALRGVAQRVGAGYRLNGGAPRRRGGRVPTAGQIRDVLNAVATASGYLGFRNRAFFQILAETGARVDALRQLDGADCVTMPSGRLRIFLHEKGKGEPREVELSRDAAAGLYEYVQGFNYHAAVRRWSVRVGLGEPGSVWRNSPRGCWAYDDILETLRSGCIEAEIVPFTPHALRRAFATDAASVLPRHTVAQAGGWKGLERLDDHYVRPRNSTIREKLRRGDHQADVLVPREDAEREPTPTL